MVHATAEGVELLFHVSAIKSLNWYRERSEATALLQLTASEPLKLTHWLERWVAQIQDLMVFGMRQPLATISVSGINAGDLGLNGLRHDVKIHQVWHPLVADLPWMAYQGRALLPANAVDDIGELIVRWFALHRELGDAAQFLFGTINDRDLPAVNRMLNLLAFAETYHRRKYDEPPLTEEQHDTFRKDMLGQLPSQYERDVYGGSPTARQRTEVSASACAGSSHEQPLLIRALRMSRRHWSIR